MNCDEIKLTISCYLDGELKKETEAFLFSHLSTCLECREEFKIQNSIQHQTKIHQLDVSEKFEKRLFASIEEGEKTFAQKWITKPTPVYINYLLGVILIVITLFSFMQVSSLRYDLNGFQQRYEASLQQINYQAMQMYNLMNSMPAVEIRPTKIFTNN